MNETIRHEREKNPIIVPSFAEGINEVRELLDDDQYINVVCLDLDGTFADARLIKYPFLHLLYSLYIQEPHLIPETNIQLLKELIDKCNETQAYVCVTTNRNIRTVDNIIWGSSYLLSQLETVLYERILGNKHRRVFLGMDRMIPYEIMEAIDGNSRFIPMRMIVDRLDKPNDKPIRFIILSDIDLASHTEYFFEDSLKKEFPGSNTQTITIVSNRFVRKGINYFKNFIGWLRTFSNSSNNNVRED